MTDVAKKVKKLGSKQLVAKLQKGAFSQEEQEVAIEVLNKRNVEYQLATPTQPEPEATPAPKAKAKAAPKAKAEPKAKTVSNRYVRTAPEKLSEVVKNTFAAALEGANVIAAWVKGDPETSTDAVIVCDNGSKYQDKAVTATWAMNQSAGAPENFVNFSMNQCAKTHTALRLGNEVPVDPRSVVKETPATETPAEETAE